MISVRNFRTFTVHVHFQIDNLLVLSGGERMNEQRGLLSGYLDMYRRLVNPELLYVNVSFAGKSCG